MAKRSRRKFKLAEARSDRVRALLAHAKSQLKQIAKGYEASIGLEHVPLDQSIRIKNFSENLRSALDYLAHQIFEWLQPGKPVPKALCFPLAWKKSVAASTIEKQFPGLKHKSPKLWEVIEEFQPYHSSNKRIRHFITIVNDSKHWDLVRQRALTVPVNSAEANGLGPVAWLSEATQEWVTFRFRGIDENAYWILLVALQEISELVDSVQWQIE